MKKITVIFDVYEFDELSETARNKAINDAIKFLTETTPYKTMSDLMKKAVNTAEKLLTPWFTGSYVYDYCKDEVLEFCRNYEYLADGKIFTSDNP